MSRTGYSKSTMGRSSNSALRRSPIPVSICHVAGKIGLIGTGWRYGSSNTRRRRREVHALVNLYVGITDYDWFQFLAALPGVDEVNFWQPGGRTNFHALRPGELFLFKLHAPRNFIVGGGVFARADILPTSLTWE